MNSWLHALKVENTKIEGKEEMSNFQKLRDTRESLCKAYLKNKSKVE